MSICPVTNLTAGQRKLAKPLKSWMTRKSSCQIDMPSVLGGTGHRDMTSFLEPSARSCCNSRHSEPKHGDIASNNRAKVVLSSPLLRSNPLSVHDMCPVFLLGSEVLTPLPELTVTSTFVWKLIYLLCATHEPAPFLLCLPGDSLWD